MSLGRAIISYSADTNIETTENRSKYFTNTNELIALLNSLGDDELDQIANEMTQIASVKYNWKTIADQYKAVINKALE